MTKSARDMPTAEQVLMQPLLERGWLVAHARKIARSQVALLRKAGLLVVPLEPTEAMITAAKKASGFDKIEEMMEITNRLEKSGKLKQDIKIMQFTAVEEYRAMLAAFAKRSRQ